MWLIKLKYFGDILEGWEHPIGGHFGDILVGLGGSGAPPGSWALSGPMQGGSQVPLVPLGHPEGPSWGLRWRPGALSSAQVGLKIRSIWLRKWIPEWLRSLFLFLNSEF